MSQECKKKSQSTCLEVSDLGQDDLYVSNSFQVGLGEFGGPELA